MKSSSWFLILSTVVCLAVGWGCATIKDAVGYPNVAVKDVHVGGLALSGLTFTFDIEIENTYGTDLPLAGFDYTLFTEDMLLLEGETPASMVIPAKEKRVVPLDLTIPYKTILNLRDQFKGKSEIPYRVDIGLKVDAPVVGRVRLPMDAEGVFRVPSFP